MNHIVKILLITLFFLLPLINSHLIDLFWIKWWFYVEWNYEFSKVIFFNIISWIMINIFILKSILLKKKIKINKFILYLILVLILSNIFSSHIFTSLLWNTSKSHSTVMFLNLIWIFLILINSKINKLKYFLKIILISSFIVWIIWIKEYFIPSFDYWNLNNRAFSTFWHPNYLSLYILIITPFIIKKIHNKYYLILFIILFILILLTKSAWWIFIFILYLIYHNFYKKNIRKKYNILFFWYLILIIILLFSIYIYIYIPEKIQSFLSRFYIWKSVITIIFSNIKIIIFWWWLWTLDFIFNWFKIPELFIYENIWFTADRPHNLVLNYFYNFWLLGLILMLYSIYKLINNYKNNIYFHSIILFFIFTIFNYPSISHYLIIILVISIIIKYNNKYDFIKNKGINYFIIFILLISTNLWIYFSIINYTNEYKNKLNENNINNNYFIKKIKSEDYIYELFINWIWNIENTCEKLIKYENSVENNFYCWNILWNYNKNKSKQYYSKWLNKLPDMWNKDSIYYDNNIIKNIFIPERFYAEKFSNLKEILKRVWK